MSARAKTTTRRNTTIPKSAARPAPKMRVNAITPFLWFDDQAEEAARFYVSIFQGSKIVRATPMTVEFKLVGQDFFALNGGPHLKLTPAYSMFVSVNTQQEVDTLWDLFTRDGGEESRCGWLVDKFGLSWQIIPTRLMELLSHKDPKVAQRATQAMLKMQKIDIAALDAAAGDGRRGRK